MPPPPPPPTGTRRSSRRFSGHPNPAPALLLAGKRFSVKAAPMQPLSAVVAEVLGQLKLPDVRPEECRLVLKGKALDLSTPVRFANIGRDKLELHTGEGCGAAAIRCVSPWEAALAGIASGGGSGMLVPPPPRPCPHSTPLTINARCLCRARASAGGAGGATARGCSGSCRTAATCGSSSPTHCALGISSGGKPGASSGSPSRSSASSDGRAQQQQRRRRRRRLAPFS